MKFETETIQNLEFDKILALISQNCISELGKVRLLNSQMLMDENQLANSLLEVTETKDIYLGEGGLPFWFFDDLRPLLNKIEPIHSYLEVSECQKVLNLIDLSGEVVKFFNKHENKYPRLRQLVSHLEPLINIKKLIESTIDPAGTIYDNASPELKGIRSEITILSKQIHLKLDKILKKNTEHIQDDYVTLREGRLVLPVREFSVNKIPGIVHGQSSTGQTHYVEPMSIVTLNNQIQELHAHEKKEIIKILKRITDQIRQHIDEISTNLALLTQIDVLIAKARYSIVVDGNAPDVQDNFEWHIKNAFHPLLLKKLAKAAVPISVDIGTDFHTMIITGPNAGGKTVSLKTIGVLQMLFQSGFHVPVAEDSKFPLCKNLFAVIGDEQSIEDDLSTFSSHITKLNQIIHAASHRSLILIDEIGKGTDPAEGSALAIAILERLNREGLVTIVTTHHAELKAFAHNIPGVINAAMQFDIKSLSPLFKLEVGIPGSSYAFDISKRLGVEQAILERAKEIMGISEHDLEAMIIDLTTQKQAFENKLSNLSIKETELDGLKALYKTRAEELSKNKKKHEQDALIEAKMILDKVNQQIETVIREIRESNAKSEIIKRGQSIVRRLKKDIESKSFKEQTQSVSIEDLAPGKIIKSKRFSIKGTISKVFSERDEVEIESDGLKIIIPVNDVEFEESVKEKQKKEFIIETPQVLNEIDLRGKIADDAIQELEKYLDQALISNWQEIRIIHGKGTGTLRQRIHLFLKKDKGIKSFRLGKFGEGDTGVTIIEMKKDLSQK
jgi:DNA mismatch repair protein MutS2